MITQTEPKDTTDSPQKKEENMSVFKSLCKKEDVNSKNEVSKFYNFLVWLDSFI